MMMLIFSFCSRRTRSPGRVISIAIRSRRSSLCSLVIIPLDSSSQRRFGLATVVDSTRKRSRNPASGSSTNAHVNLWLLKILFHLNSHLGGKFIGRFTCRSHIIISKRQAGRQSNHTVLINFADVIAIGLASETNVERVVWSNSIILVRSVLNQLNSRAPRIQTRQRNRQVTPDIDLAQQG